MDLIRSNRTRNRLHSMRRYCGYHTNQTNAFINNSYLFLTTVPQIYFSEDASFIGMVLQASLLLSEPERYCSFLFFVTSLTSFLSFLD